MVRNRTLFGLIAVAVVVALVLVGCSVAAPAPAKSEAPAPAKAAALGTPTSAPSVAPTQAPPASKAAAAEVKPLDPPVAVKVGHTPVTTAIGVIVAQQRGYFRDEGLNVELVQFATWAAMVQPLILNELDVGGVPYGPGSFNALQRAVGIRFVASASAYAKGTGPRLNVRKDIADQVKTIADLKGRKVGLPARPTIYDVGFDMALRKVGLRLDDVDFIPGLSGADVNTAFANRGLDAGMQTAPTGEYAIRQGLAVTWKTFDEIYPDAEAIAWTYSERLIKERPEAAKRFMVAYLRGYRDYMDVFFAKKGNRSEMIAMVGKLANLNDPTLFDEMIHSYGNPDGYINKDMVQNDANWYFDHKLINAKIDVSTFVDNQYADYALGRLGRYQK